MTRLALNAAQTAVMESALADAEQYRRDGGTWCADCAASPGSPCPGHIADLDQANAYRDLRDRLAQAIPGQRAKGRPRCSEHRSRP